MFTRHALADLLVDLPIWSLEEDDEEDWDDEDWEDPAGGCCLIKTLDCFCGKACDCAHCRGSIVGSTCRPQGRLHSIQDAGTSERHATQAFDSSRCRRLRLDWLCAGGILRNKSPSEHQGTAKGAAGRSRKSEANFNELQLLMLTVVVVMVVAVLWQ